MSDSSGQRICVVNDNPEFLELMTEILGADEGYDVRTYLGQRVSVEELARHAPDLIMIDLLLGGASGWEIVALARADERLARVPIIVCSADVASLRERSAELERIGDVHILPKPFSVDQVTGLIEELLGRGDATTG